MATIITTTREIIVIEDIDKLAEKIAECTWISVMEKVYSNDTDPYTHQLKSYKREIDINTIYIVEIRN
jgi:hypothetical protein